MGSLFECVGVDVACRATDTDRWNDTETWQQAGAPRSDPLSDIDLPALEVVLHEAAIVEEILSQYLKVHLGSNDVPAVTSIGSVVDVRCTSDSSSVVGVISGGLIASQHVVIVIQVPRRDS